jgi:hypothetical protein
MALLVAAFAGCTGEGVNRANVFKPQGGTVDLNVSNLADASAYTAVAFELDGQPLGAGEMADGGWTYKWNTTSGVTDGIHTVRAVGTTADGTTVELLNNSLFIQNNGATETPSAAPSAAASDAGTGTEPAAGEEAPEAGAGEESGTDADAEPSSFQRPR